MRLTAAFLLAWIAIHVVAPSASASVPTLPVVAQDGVLGRWSLRYLQPGKVEPSIVRMVVEAGVESTVTAYGLGVNVSRVQDEFLVIAHSGGQLKTSTFLMCCPDLGLAVALMCNTEGTQLSDLAGELLGMLIADQQE